MDNKLLFTLFPFLKFLLLSFWLVQVSRAEGDVPFIPSDYEKESLPSVPVEIYFKIHVITVAPIISSDLEFRVNMRLTMSWRDARVSLSSPDIPASQHQEGDNNIKTLLPLEFAQKLWLPDPYFLNSKFTGIKSFGGRLMNFYLDKNSILSYTMILNATVACPMDFRFYPIDTQTCPLTIQSFEYDVREVIFKWAEDGLAFKVTPRRLIQFTVKEPPMPTQQFRYNPGQGNVSVLIATFTFERLVGSHLVQSFIPCSLVVILSWFSFWLTLEVTAARAGLLMIAMLSLVTHLGGLKSEFPPVAYVKAVDIWIFACMAWIFCALAEFVMVKVIYGVTEEVRRENLVYALRDHSRKRLFQKTANGSANEYTEWWLWKEILNQGTLGRSTEEDDTGAGRRWNLNLQRYEKKRLGSIVLSGRSVATEDLSIMERKFFWGKLRLVWFDKLDGRRRVLWREMDNVARWLFPLTFFLFSSIYWAILIIHQFV